MPIHKVRTLKILEFYTPSPLSLFGYPFDDPFPNNVRTFSSIPPYQKHLMEIVLFCFLPEKKSFVDFPLFWQSRKGWQPSRAVHEAQYLGFNIFLSTCWEHLFYHGSSSKSYSCRHFSKYLPNNSRTLSNHQKNYAKTFFCSRILHSYFQSHSFRLPSSNEANCKIDILLTGIWIPGRTCVVEVWLNKSAT